MNENFKKLFPDIESKTSEELFTLVTVPQKLDQYFETLPQVKNQQHILADFKLGNANQSRDNLKFQPELKRLHELIHVKSQKIKELEAEYYKLKNEETALLQNYESSYFLPKLRKQQETVELESKDIYQKFKAKEIDIDTFLDEFKQNRTEFHKYDIRLNEITSLPVIPKLNSMKG